MRAVVWLVRAFIFFTLFAFALNNQQQTVVNWYFGLQWKAPMIMVVLAAFALGCAVGVLAMVPSWWRHRQHATRRAQQAAAKPPTELAGTGAVVPAELSHPPRDGL